MNSQEQIVNGPAFVLPADGMVCLCAVGEVPAEVASADPKKPLRFVQVFDRECFEGLARAINSSSHEVLVDFDHESCDQAKRTDAAGWVKPGTVVVRNNGIWAPVRWSDDGLAAIRGGRVRYTSPTFNWPDHFEHLGGNRYRPTGLDSVAVTNRPRIPRMPPISILNRAPAAPAQPQPTSKKSMKKVTDLLGLAADASEDAIAAAVQLIQNSEKTSKEALVTNRKAEAAQICAEREITDEGVIEAFTTVFVSNRDAALKLLPVGKEKKAPPVKPVHNREKAAAAPNGKATTPGSEGEDAATKAADETRAAKIRNRASEIQRTQRVSYTQAWQLAEAEVQPAA